MSCKDYGQTIYNPVDRDIKPLKGKKKTGPVPGPAKRLSMINFLFRPRAVGRGLRLLQPLHEFVPLRVPRQLEL